MPVCHSERSAWPPNCRKKSAWKPAGTATLGSPHSESSAASGCAVSIQARISAQSRPVSTRPGSSLTRDAAMSTRKPLIPRSNQYAMTSRSACRLARGPSASTGWRHGSRSLSAGVAEVEGGLAVEEVRHVVPAAPARGGRPTPAGAPPSATRCSGGRRGRRPTPGTRGAGRTCGRRRGRAGPGCRATRGGVDEGGQVVVACRSGGRR